jgi:hypothetical protein
MLSWRACTEAFIEDNMSHSISNTATQHKQQQQKFYEVCQIQHEILAEGTPLRIDAIEILNQGAGSVEGVECRREQIPRE